MKQSDYSSFPNAEKTELQIRKDFTFIIKR